MEEIRERVSFRIDMSIIDPSISTPLECRVEREPISNGHAKAAGHGFEGFDIGVSSVNQEQNRSRNASFSNAPLHGSFDYRAHAFLRNGIILPFDFCLPRSIA